MHGASKRTSMKTGLRYGEFAVQHGGRGDTGYNMTNRKEYAFLVKPHVAKRNEVHERKSRKKNSFLGSESSICPAYKNVIRLAEVHYVLLPGRMSLERH